MPPSSDNPLSTPPPSNAAPPTNPAIPPAPLNLNDVTPPIPQPGVVIGGADMPPASSRAFQSQPSTTMPQAAAVTTGSGLKEAKKPRNKKKLAIISAAVVVVLGGGLAAAYFGYYMNPNFIWKQSLSDSNIAYNRLVGYANTGQQSHYKGVNETGSFSATLSGASYDGSIDIKSDSSNSSISTKVDFGTAKLDLEERSIKATGNSEPDVYLQVNGLKSVSSVLSGQLGPQLGPRVAALDGKWIVVDHNLIIDIKNELVKAQKANSKPQLTWADVNSFLQAAGKVNKQYVFTTAKNTAVTKVLQKYGREKVDGHDTYHYKVGFVPAHVKAYVTAMCSALQTSDLGAYIKAETSQDVGTSSTCKDLESGATNISSSDTIQVWADVNHRVIYKIRIPFQTNPAENFVDVGLNYTGGSTYPFFVTGQSKDSTGGTSKYSVTATFKADHSVSVALNVIGSGDNAGKLSGNFSFQPTNTTLSLQAPQNAIPVITILNEFGLGGTLTQLQQFGSGQLLGSLTPKTGTSSKTAQSADAAALASLITSSLSSGSKSISN